MSSSSSSNLNSNQTNQTKSSSSNLTSSEKEISSKESNQKEKIAEDLNLDEDQDQDQEFEVGQESDDYRRPFSLNSIPRNSLSSDQQEKLSFHSFSPPTTPPSIRSNPPSNHDHLSQIPPNSNLQRQRLLTGPTPTSETSKLSIVSTSSEQIELKFHSPIEPQSTHLPLRKDSDTSTIWRSSLASVNESSLDLSTQTPTQQSNPSSDLISEPRPVSLLDLQTSRRDGSNEVPSIEKLDIHLTSTSVDLSDSKSPLKHLQDVTDENLSSTTRLGPSSRSGATSPRTPTGESFDPSIIHPTCQSPLLEEDESKRKSLLEGRHKLIENFTRVQEEMTGSSSTTLKSNPNLIQEEGSLNGIEDCKPNAIKAQEDLNLKCKKNSSSLVYNPIDWDFWGSVMNDYEEIAKQKPKELSRAIQSGIPPALRGMMWQLMSSSKDVELELEYSRLLNQICPHEKSITRDLNRTFPQLEYFKESGGLGQDSLLAVCKAFSLYDPEVGYTQGLQFIIGPMLLNMPDEEAFCVLVRLMNSYDLRSHFIPNMPGLQLRLFQFDRILEDLLPHVYMHLLRQGIKSSMYASQWFLTLFGYRFPLELVSVVMDLVFAEGLEAVFRFGLSLMKKNEKQICEMGFDKLLDFLKLSLFEPYKNEDSLQDSLNSQPFPCDSDSIPRAAVVDKSSDSNPTTRKRSVTDSYRAQEFIKDALQIKITPMMLDQYASEWESICREKNAHQIEIDRLRDANAQLSAQVRRLETNLAQVNEEHCDLVKQVVMAKLDREELEEELVKYKMAFADLSHQQASEGSKQHRASIISTKSINSNGP
ncbi:rab-GTPase-TBC domain-containing protein [Melampsora americana]|nr:rab-GTPase-TBC domain-containing protein [Melampsora americana]